MVDRLFQSGLPSLAAVGLGLVIGWIDVLAPMGDDSEKLTLLLWLGTCGLLGFLRPRHAWRWALLVAPWASVFYVVRLALNQPVSLNPPTYLDALILLPVSIFVCLLGAYAGVLGRWVTRAAGAVERP